MKKNHVELLVTPQELKRTLETLSEKEVVPRFIEERVLSMYNKRVNVFHVLKEYVGNEIAKHIARQLALFLSQPTIVLPFWEMKNDRDMFLQTLPEEARKVLDVSPTRRRRHAMVISLIDLMVQSKKINLFTEEIDNVHNVFKSFDWNESSNHLEKLLLHTSRMQETVKVLCEKITQPIMGFY